MNFETPERINEMVQVLSDMNPLDREKLSKNEILNYFHPKWHIPKLHILMIFGKAKKILSEKIPTVKEETEKKTQRESISIMNEGNPLPEHTAPAPLSHTEEKEEKIPDSLPDKPIMETPPVNEPLEEAPAGEPDINTKVQDWKKTALKHCPVHVRVQLRIREILQHLEKGEDLYDFIDELSAPWNVSDRTLRRYLADANILLNVHTEREALFAVLAKKEAKDELTEKKIKGKLERQAILSSIVDKSYDVEKEVFVNGKRKKVKRKPTPTEVVKAIDMLNKDEEKEDTHVIRKRRKIIHVSAGHKDNNRPVSDFVKDSNNLLKILAERPANRT
jgi:hypothetical protein